MKNLRFGDVDILTEFLKDWALKKYIVEKEIQMTLCVL